MKKIKIEIGRVKNKIFFNEKLTEAQLNHHVHVVGASGFGKTVLLTNILRQQIAFGMGVMFIDLKSDQDTITEFREIAKASGRESDVAIFSITDQSISSSYNLLGTGTATQLHDRIMQSFNWSEEFYKNQASSFLLNVLIPLCYLRDQKFMPLHLGTVFKAVSQRAYLEEVADQIPLSEVFEREAIERAIDFARENGSWSSLQGLRSQIESIVKSDFGRLVTSEEFQIDLFEAVKAQKLIFLFLDTRRYGETAKVIGRFILQDLKSVSARIDNEIAKVDRKSFSVIIDEFADLAQEDFIAFLDRARSSKMSIIISHQEISDLQKVSMEFAGRLMGNTSTLYAFLQKRPESAELISSTAGTHTVRKRTYAHEKFWLFDVQTGSSSVREVEEFVIHPNVIKRLTVGECVCVQKYPRSKASVVKIRVKKP